MSVKSRLLEFQNKTFKTSIATQFDSYLPCISKYDEYKGCTIATYDTSIYINMKDGRVGCSVSDSCPVPLEELYSIIERNTFYIKQEYGLNINTFYICVDKEWRPEELNDEDYDYKDDWIIIKY